MLREIACIYGLVYDPLLIIPVTLLIASLGKTTYDMVKILVATWLLELLVHVAKYNIPSVRPCQELGLNCCPSTNDIPSGHAALGMFHGLLLYNMGYRYESMFFFLQGVSRYVGKQHSAVAIMLGSVMGAVWYHLMFG